jgi:drug/metabolite transporter (DMT)-like permease
MHWKNSYHPYAATTILFWSMAFVFTRLALPYFSVFSLGLWRYATASAVLLIVAVSTRMAPPRLRDVPWFLLAGAVGFTLYMVVFNLGSQTVSASTGSVMLATTPILTALLARVFYGEKLTALKYAAIGLSFAGVVVLNVLRGGFSLGGGVMLMLLGALMTAVYNILQRKLTRTYAPLRATTFSIFCGTAMLCVFLPQGVRDIAAAPPVAIGYVLFLGVFSGAVAYVAWSKALSLAKDTSSVSNYMFVTPFLTTLLGLWIANEPVEASTVVGGLMIIAGLLLFRFGERFIRRGKPVEG